MAWIKARIRFLAKRADGKAATPEDAQLIVNQVRQDALYGTFAELDQKFWESRMERGIDKISFAYLLDHDVGAKDGVYEFELNLTPDYFPPELGGLQHLFGILAGDLLQFTLSPLKVERIEITHLELPDDWIKECKNLFRGTANAIEDVRLQFGLDPGMPLLALSFKPRVGFKLESLKEAATEVLAEGFNIVELDTRFLAKDASTLHELVDLSIQLSQLSRKHTGRLSLNLSLPTSISLEIIEVLCERVPGPVVFKVDGGLDGLSTLQAVRRKKIICKASGKPPIITCYPLLRSALRNFIPEGHFVNALTLSGADIIYPGGRPNIGSMRRSIGESQSSNLRAVEKYRDFIKARAPMPSIAGGIYAGQLQAFYELFGGDVAWFLGGGVALHKEGPKAGAKLCYRIAREAVKLRDQAGRDWADDVPEILSTECEEMFAGRSSLDAEDLKYVSPKGVLSKIDGLKPI